MRLFLPLLCLVATAQTAEDPAEHVKRAAALASQSRLEDSAAEYQKALDIHRARGDKFRQGIVLNNLAAAWVSAGDPDAAFPLLDEALAIRESLNDQLGVAYTLLGMANAHWFAGEPQLALDAYRRLIAQAGVVKNDNLLAHALNNGGLVLQSLGEDAAALTQHNTALDLFRKSNQRVFEGYALNNAGLAQINLGRAAEARMLFEQALAIFRELQDTRAQAYALHNLGDLELRGGKPDAAIPFYRQALVQKRAARDRYGEAWSLARLGEANAARGDAAGAAMLLDQALKIQRSVADRAGEAATLATLARVERAADPPAAIAHLFEALQIVEQTRGTVVTPELRGSYFSTRQSIYEFLISLLVELRDPRAVEISERSRARLLLDSLAGDRQADSLGRSIHALGQRLQRASTPADAAAGRERLRKLEEAAAKLPPPARGQPLDLPGLQRLATPDGAVLEYWLGEDRSAAFLIRPGKVTVQPLPPRRTVEAAIGKLLTALTARGAHVDKETPAQRKERLATADAAWPVHAAALAKLIWPAAALEGVNQVLVVPHHGLARLPFPLLPGVEKLNITQIPSASMLPFLGTRAPEPTRVAIYAAPDFPATLPPLPFARTEAESIARLVPPDQLTLRLGPAAAVTPALPKELAANRLLHFATHVELDGRPPRIELTNSRLTLDSIAALSLDADLVTLSACRTALGQELSGEGLISFTRAFLYAGANRVLATLWSVDDQATAAFMKSFYTHLLGKHLPPAAALAAARDDLRKQPRYTHPWYWAGFALYGQWR